MAQGNLLYLFKAIYKGYNQGLVSEEKMAQIPFFQKITKKSVGWIFLTTKRSFLISIGSEAMPCRGFSLVVKVIFQFTKEFEYYNTRSVQVGV